MKKKLFFLSLYLIVLSTVLLSFFIHYSGEKRWMFSNFIHNKVLIEKNVSSKGEILAYGVYKTVEPGKYDAVFHYKNALKGGTYIFEIAYKRGKKIKVQKPIKISDNDGQVILRVKLGETVELEPRVRIRDRKGWIYLDKVELIRTSFYISPFVVFYKSILIFIFLSIVIFSFLNVKSGEGWKKWLALFFVSGGFYAIFIRSWISEDAFITLRIIRNFLSGHGLVYNIGERVEGFTHALWFFVVSGVKVLGVSYKGAAILPALLFSLLTLYFLFFKIRFGEKSFKLNFAGIMLIGSSAFIDFGTSGLETSLSFLLLSLYAYFISENLFIKKPLLFGLLLSLLVLNRPDFGVFLILLLLIFSYKLIKKQIQTKILVEFLIPVFLFLGGYQIFRMGYFASFFPNPFYTKSGAGSYFSQGILYLKDLVEGSLFLVAFLLGVLALIITRKNYSFKARLLIFFSGFIHGFFVVRGGGDFMHGRFLLPAFLLISSSSIGAFDFLFEKNTFRKAIGVALSILIFAIALYIKPVQKRGRFYNKGGISDERFAYYKNKKLEEIGDLFKEDIIFMWKTMGQDYKRLSEKSGIRLKIAYKNIGFLGFYAGENVYIVDKLGLTDPIVSRVKIRKRRRPGHEKMAPFAYLEYRKLTFGATPFKIWNSIAHTKYGILWDISPRTLRKFSFFLPKNFKSEIDRRLVGFFRKCDINCKKKNANLLFFLKKFWYPFAGIYRSEFDKVYDIELIKKYSSDYKWFENNKKRLFLIEERISGQLTFKKFLSNIGFAIFESGKIYFDEEGWHG